MKKFAILLIALLGVVGLAGQLSGARADSNSPVICDEHPTEPWMCAPLDGTFNDWPYLSGSYAPAPDSYDNPTLDAYADDSVYLIAGNMYWNMNYGTPVTTQSCRVRANLRRFYAGGKYWTRGSGSSSCTYLGAPVVKTWLITVCLLKASVFPFFEVAHCHPKSGVGTSISHKIYHSCRSTASRYWKSEVLVLATQPGWQPAYGVQQSRSGLFPCG